MPQYGFYFDSELCIKCHACETACKLWNEVPEGSPWRQVVQIQVGVFPQVREANVSMACMHCGDPPCLHACPVKAISKRQDTGIVVVDPQVCIGCAFCAWACPFGAPQLGFDGKMQKCHFCQDGPNPRPLGMPRPCEEVCPTAALRTGTMAERALMGRTRAAQKLAFSLPDPGQSNFIMR
jgi:anaerobic dimethyl sulfoxide reductase subunit B (iron-sulfur subunit)